MQSVVIHGHRLSNQTSNVAKQALRTPSAPEVIRESIESRLLALSRSHDLSTRESWHSVGLLDLINEATAPFGVACGRPARLVITGENIRLSPINLGPWQGYGDRPLLKKPFELNDLIKVLTPLFAARPADACVRTP